MNIQDVIFSPTASMDLKIAIIQMVHQHHLTPYTKVLTPSSTNDDVNGSQHVRNGGTDFTYDDADFDTVASASSLGYYEYFSNYYGRYTGHYYNGDGNHFDAVVIDPPAYAVDVQV